MLRDDVPTPALLLDLDAFESNVATMATFVRSRGKGLRPHGKTHKTIGNIECLLIRILKRMKLPSETSRATS